MIKFILNIAIVLMISTVIVFSQDSTSKKLPETNTPQENQKSQKKEFVDKNANGIDDSKEENNTESEGSGKQQRNRQKDHFIDKDGDGINDNRCNGFGACKGMGKGRRAGKK